MYHPFYRRTHTLRETNPYILPGPGGAINLHECKFEQVDDNKVRVSGSKFVPTDKYYVKLEGVRRVGFRTMRLQRLRILS